MTWGMVAVAGATLVGGAMSSSAAKGASKDQAAAADRATEAERLAMERQIELQAPWREAGGLGINRLSYLLGVSPTGTFTPGSTMNPSGAGGTTGVGSTAETRDQILARLSPQYLTQVPQATGQTGGAEAESGNFGGGPAVPLVNRLDEVALNAAVDAELAKQQQAAKATQTSTNALAATAAGKDPAYGSLLRNFGMQDFERDPGIQFQREEGMKGLDRSAAASGRFSSGRAMKDITRFNQGLASQEWGAAFNRFNTNQDKTYNRLASLAGIGQTATNQVGGAVGQFGSSSANNIIGAGDAAAAGRVGSANAWNNAIGQGVSAYQQNSMMGGFGGGGNRLQASFSNTGLGSSGFGTGLAYGNQDFGGYI